MSIETKPLAFARADGVDMQAQLHRSAQADARRGRAIVMVHGGAWTSNDRHTPAVLCEALAADGFTVLSLDFRDGRQGKHPCAVQDITAGIRYARANANALGVDAERIGLIGSSSGGHLVLLSACQPDAEPHQGTPVFVGEKLQDAAGVSASVTCVAALWPVSDPLARLRYARRVGRDELVQAHFRYYRDEQQMRQASVPRMLAAGEAQATPPLFLVQPGADANVPRQMTLDLVSEYQEAGGTLHYRFLPGLPHAFAYEASPATTALAVELDHFFKRYLCKRTGR